jgi:hypothetical protein
MPKADIERSFPRLAADGFHITSAASAVYNCAAWAAAESHRWWDPSPVDGYYWPTRSGPSESLGTLLAAFATLGYGPCSDGRLEPGYEKLALYADEHGCPTHVARQLAFGAWTSKLGASEDIEHKAAEALEGDLHGRVVQYLRRQRLVKRESGTPSSA